MIFSCRQAVEITGISHRQLAYWNKSKLITPSIRTKGGHARYTFLDLIALKTLKQLIAAGVSTQKIRKNIVSLLEFLPTLDKPLSELSLVATGDVILVFHQGAAFEALSGQEWIFPVAAMQREIEQWQKAGKHTPAIQTDLFKDIKMTERKKKVSGHR